MDFNKLFSEIDNLEDKYLKVWEELCNIESPTSDKAAVDEAGRYLIAIAESCGYSVKVLEERVSGNPISITVGEGSGEPVVFSGHIDTVFSKGAFGYPPVTYQEDTIHGPGVNDCKGGVVAAFYAAEALARMGYNKRPIKIIIQTDEEMSSAPSEKRTVDFMMTEARGAVAFLNCEGLKSGKLVLSRKGILDYKWTVKGVEAHSSSSATMGSNAIAEAASKILEIEKIKDKDGITASVNIISGGATPNTVAGECSFIVDVRYATEAQRAEVEARFAEIAASAYIEGCTTQVELFKERPPMELVDRNIQLLARINEAFAKAGLPVLESAFSAGGSDAAYATAAGIPCVDNFGTRGGYIHSTKEYAFIASLKESAIRLAVAAAEL